MLSRGRSKSTARITNHITPTFHLLSPAFVNTTKLSNMIPLLHQIKVLLNPCEGEANSSVITRTKTRTLGIYEIHNLLLVPNIPRLKLHLAWFGEKIGTTLNLNMIEFVSWRKGNVYTWFLGLDVHPSCKLHGQAQSTWDVFIVGLTKENMFRDCKYLKLDVTQRLFIHRPDQIKIRHTHTNKK